MATPSTRARLMLESEPLVLVLVVELVDTVVKSVKVAVPRVVPGSLMPAELTVKSTFTEDRATLLKTEALSNYVFVPKPILLPISRLKRPRFLNVTPSSSPPLTVLPISVRSVATMPTL